jgi:mono/diheme cytochrome c family protein
MSSSLVITLAVIGGIAWLAFLLVSALRSRGKEEIAPNLAQGRTDEELETRRLERVQQGAVLLAGFLAVGLPLYFLGETQRQESFVEQFDEESVRRGEHLVTEFGCFNCHGAGGSGGSASYIEKRIGVSTLWAAPSLDDVLYRYSPEEVNFWVTYGRPNTPMPPWGVAGGGAMNEAQVQDIVNYLQTIQITQQDALAKIQGTVNGQLTRLEGAEAAVASVLRTQRQLVADINRAESLAGEADRLTKEMRDVLDAAEEGIDTDGDGLSDVAETTLSELTSEFAALWSLPNYVPLTLDPANSQSSGRPDREAVDELLETLRAATTDHPILESQVDAIEVSLADGPDDGDDEIEPDQDGDGLTDAAEAAISTASSLAVSSVRPTSVTVVTLDPSNPESSGDRDLDTATAAVSANEGVALQLTVTRDNKDSLLEPAVRGVEALEQAAADKKWEIDLQGVADVAFGGDLEKATRAVGLFNGYCARCHTSGWSAGVPFTQIAGSGGFGPALWEGRENLQFLTVESLMKFIAEGSVAQAAYGVNGIGSGRMPAFGAVLSAEDIELVASYLRSGNLTGKE